MRKLILFLSSFLITTICFAATVTKTIGTNSRDYATVTAWEADLDNVLIYSPGDDAVGVIYADSDFDESPVINGGGTVGLNSIKLTVAAADRHDGTAGSGARMVATANRWWRFQSPVHTTFEWFELNLNGNSVAGSGNQTSGAGGFTMQHVIIWGANSTGTKNTFFVNGADANIMNNIIYDIDGSSTGNHGILVSATGKTVNILNNTIHAISTGDGIVLAQDEANYTVKNNIVTNAGDDYSFTAGSSNIVSDYNLSSDATAVGSNSLQNKSASNQFVSITGGSEDLHLKTGADAKDEGVDLGTTPSGVEVDIDGFDRNADATYDPWDMGAHELQEISVSERRLILIN